MNVAVLPRTSCCKFDKAWFGPDLYSRAKILGHARYPSPARRAPSPLGGVGVTGPFAGGSEHVSKLMRNHIEPGPAKTPVIVRTNPTISRVDRRELAAIHRFICGQMPL